MFSLLLSAALFAGADTDPVPAPKGPPPTLVYGRVNKDGNLTVTQTLMVPVTVRRKVNKVENGQVVTVEVEETRYEMITRLSDMSLAKATITDATGKKLDQKALAKKLAKAAVVALSADGKPVEVAYRKALKADTVVIVLPVTAPVAPPPPPIKDKSGIDVKRLDD